MVQAPLLILVGLLLLTGGAEGLVRGAGSTARRFGLSPLLIGLTVVAYGTSTPELVVSVSAALSGKSDIALSNVIGSNIGNLGLILGLAALLCPIRTRMQILRVDVPVMIGVSLLLLGLLSDGGLSRGEGLLLFVAAILYTGFTFRWAPREMEDDTRDEFDSGMPVEGSWGRDLLYLGGGLLLLVVGARWLVSGAVTVAEALGLSSTVIGLTVVAVGTSLPEMATSVVAALRGESDIALGNVVGSNIFNVLGILGVTATLRPVDVSGLTGLDGAAMVGFAVLTLPLVWTGYTFSRREGVLFLVLYGAYVGALLGLPG